MAKRATLTTITAGHTSASKINANMAALNVAFDNTLSLDGSVPNAMSGDFDMGDNDILNVGDIEVDDLTIGGVSVAAQATAAAASATAAATSETNAIASFDAFDDIYLGAKSSDPSLDNDGNALAAGALYFKTVGDSMRVYSGSSWADIAPSGGTVSSVGIADAGATEITVTNTPITTSGEINLAIATIAGTKIDFSGGGDLDAAVVAKQASDATLTSLAAVAGVAGDILIASGTDEWARLAKGTDGEVLKLASGLPSWASAVVATIVSKTADETVTNSTTLQDDDHLVFALVANTSYAVNLVLLLNVTSDTPDFKFGWTVPAGCTMFWEETSSRAWGGGAPSQLLTSEAGTDPSFAVIGTNGALYTAIVRNGANAGNLQLRWAQNTAHGSDIKLLKHSHMIIRNLGAT